MAIALDDFGVSWARPSQDGSAGWPGLRAASVTSVLCPARVLLHPGLLQQHRPGHRHVLHLQQLPTKQGSRPAPAVPEEGGRGGWK